MSKPTSDLTDLAQIAADMVVATQAASMRLLEAEMQAMAQMIPGAEPKDGQTLPTDDEVEEGFENMPV